MDRPIEETGAISGAYAASEGKESDGDDEPPLGNNQGELEGDNLDLEAADQPLPAILPATVPRPTAPTQLRRSTRTTPRPYSYADSYTSRF